MRNDMKDIFNAVPGGDETVEQFLALLELPDEQFDTIYPMFKEQIKKAYSTQEFQQQMLTQLQLTPIDDVEEEKRAIKEFVNEITDDDTFSANKKDLIQTMFYSVLEVFEQLALYQRTMVGVDIYKLNPDAIIPEYAHNTDAGADIFAVEEVIINPNETKIVKTGIALAIPAGYEIQIRPRSGLSAKTGLRIPNAPGTIDSDYRGEVGVIMQNTGDTPYTVEKGAKIAQMLIAPTPMIRWKEVNSLEELGTTSRGAGGFGSTDKTEG